MTKTKKALIVLLSVLCLVCMGMFTLTACSKKTLQSIKITTPPAKTVYITGEKFDATGMKVTAKYSDNTEAELDSSAWDWDVKEALTVADGKFEANQTIKVTYTENDVTANASTTVKVTNYITEATVTTYPEQEYFLGQSFSVSGMKINAKLQSGNSIDLEVTSQNSTVSPNGALSKSDTEVTVTVGGYEIKVPVTVLNAIYVEAETGYRNGALIEQTTGESGNLRTDATTETAQKGAQSLYASHLKALFALEKLSENEDFDADALASQAATPDELSEVFGGTKSVYSQSVTVGGEIVSKLYVETVKWIKDKDNKEALDEYVASEEYEAALEAFIAGTNEDIDEWNYEEIVVGYTAHAGSDGNEYYLGQNNQGNIISFVFDSSAATTGNIAFRLSSAYLYIDSGWVAIAMGDIQFNKLCEFYVNGVKYDIDDDVILYGGKTEDGSTNNVLWCNWKEVSFDDVAFVEGRNVIELRILRHGISAQENYSFAANIDTLLVAPSVGADGKDSCQLDTYDNSKVEVSANATSVTISDDGVVTISGTYSGVEGYVADILGITVGNASAEVITNMTSGTFTATIDVSAFELGDYKLSATKGDSTTVYAETVTIGYNDFKFVVDGSTITLNVDSEYKVIVNSATIGTPVITLENRDGKACLVIAGGTYDATVEKFTDEEALPHIAAAIAKLYYSDLQENPNEGGGGNWAMVVTNTHYINVLADNKFEVVIDLTNIKPNAMTMHFVHAKEDGTYPTGGDSDFKPDIDAFESNLVLVIGDMQYEVIYDKTTYFACVGVKVSEYGKPTVTANAVVELEANEDNTKIYLVIDGTYENYDSEEELLADILDSVDAQNPDDGWNATDLTEKATVELDKDNETFKILVDITGVANGQYLVHLNGNDVGHEGGIDSIVVGTKQYSYENRNFDGWSRYVLTIKDYDPTAKVIKANPVSIEVEDDKVYYVITGTFANYTQEELEAAKLDFENGEDGSDITVLDASKITVTISDGTYTVKGDITDLKAGCFWVHWKGVLADNGDVGNSSGTEAVTLNGKSYAYADYKFSWGTTKVLIISEASADEE